MTDTKKKSADIKSLPGIHWSPAAALADVQVDIDDIRDIFIIYHRKNKEHPDDYNSDWLCHRAANLTNKDIHWMLSKYLSDTFTDD